MRHLGIFVKEPVPGRVKTRLASTIGPDAGAELYRAFVGDLTDRFRTTADARWLGFTPVTDSSRAAMRSFAGHDYELWPQPDADLGVRIADFFAITEAAGAIQTVLIGSDSPNLPREFVEQAFAALATTDVVLGPATDGGYYLIGSRRPLTGVLDGVRWSTAHTLADTAVRIAAAGLTVSLLPPWYDIDTADDLTTLAGHFAASRLADPQVLMTQTEAWLLAHQSAIMARPVEDARGVCYESNDDFPAMRLPAASEPSGSSALLRLGIVCSGEQ